VLGPPPLLTPTAIFRQILWDPSEIAPTWARPKPAVESDAVATTVVPPEPASVDGVGVDDAIVATTQPTTAASPPPKRARGPKKAGATTAKPRSTTRARKATSDPPTAES
jgi:hypothetical protein